MTIKLPTLIYKGIVLLVFTTIIHTATIAQPILSFSPVITTGLSAPIQLVNAGDGSNKVFIVEKGGTVKVYDAAFNFLGTYVTVSNVSMGGERGLLSMVFHPDYANNGFSYVYYTNANGNLEIARYHASSNPNMADAATKQIVITIPHPTNANHNGGEMHFGADGFLYLSTGDGGGGGDQPNNAQNTNVLLGKIIRINVNTSATPPFYTIPAGNPFNNEVFAYGLRNPFRWSFDRLTHDMWIGDVGQGAWEEINYRASNATAGVNYGWRCYEGNSPYNTSGCTAMSNYVFPVYVYPNTGGAAVTGGIVYRGAISTAMYGYYIATDFYSGIFTITSPDGTGGWTTTTQTLTPTGIADFGETENGEAFVVSLISNAIYRLNAVEGAPLPVRLVNFGGSIVNKQVQLHWKSTLEQNLQSFEVEYSMDGASFVNAGNVLAKNIAAGADYSFIHTTAAAGIIFYRLKMKDNTGTHRYSETIKIVANSKDNLFVSPSVISDAVIHLNLTNTMYSSVEIMSTNGAVLIKRNINSQTGRINIPAGQLSPGMYMVRLISDKTAAVTQKILIQ